MTTEKRIHTEAFEYYYDLGDKRSIEAVADHYGKAIKTIYKWSTTFKWKERVKELDVEVGRLAREKLVKRHVDMREQGINLIQLSLDNYAMNLARGEVSIKTAFELDKLLDRMEKMFGGDKDSNKTEININTNTGMTEEDREALKELSKSIASKLTEEIEEEEE